MNTIQNCLLTRDHKRTSEIAILVLFQNVRMCNFGADFGPKFYLQRKLTRDSELSQTPFLDQKLDHAYWLAAKHGKVSLITVTLRMKIEQLFLCRITIQLRCRQIGRHGTSGDFFNFLFLTIRMFAKCSRSDKLDWCLLLLDMIISCGMN